jgi:glyoxylase-like metal-dependent hydrolase (beta-lactamase superfamily II)
MFPMTTRTLASFLAAAALAGCTPATPERQALDDALAALGGRGAIEAVRTLTIEGEGVNYNLGQDLQPEAATQTFAISAYRRVIDVANRRQRVEQTRTPRFAYFQGPQPQRQVLALDGAVAFNVNAQGQAARLGALPERDRHHDFYHHPLTLLRAALHPQATIANVRTVGAARQADITTAAGPVLTLTIDAAGVPLSISSRAYHPNLGDVVITTRFGAYQDVDGLRLPARFAGTVDDFTTWEITATRQAVDDEAGDLAAPATVASTPLAPPALTVTAEPIGPGLWFMAGQSHHSVLVEFSDHLMLIEAPQSEARTLAVIAKAKETVPNKPLTQLVISHHHFDHTAGLRAAIAEGMRVITHAGNRDWVERMANRPHTLQPDTLAKNASHLAVEAVDTEREFRDGAMTLSLFHVAGNPHSDTMLMAYFPRHRVLVEVDAYSPGGAYHPYAANLLENIAKRKLAVDRIVPLHGGIVPFADLASAASATAQR